MLILGFLITGVVCITLLVIKYKLDIYYIDKEIREWENAHAEK